MTMRKETVAAIRYVSALVILSVALSGCRTCRKITSKLPFLGRRPSVVATPPPLEPVEPPPMEPVATPTVEPEPVAPPTEPTEAPRPEEEPQVEEALKMVHFDFDSAALTDEARRILDENIKWLKAHPDVRIQIEGHCDERGTEEYNLHLGQRRAESVKRYLVKNGIDPKRLFTISYGEERPIDPGHDESAWRKNRRAQFSRF